MHTSSEVLALRALGEDVGTPSDREHLAGCAQCAAELAGLARVVDVGRSLTANDILSTPSAQVWERISAELRPGFPIAAAPGVPPTPVRDLEGLRRRQAPVQPGPLEQRPLEQRPLEQRPPEQDSLRPWGGATPLPQSGVGRRWVAMAVAAALLLVAGFGAGIGYSRLGVPKERVIAQTALAPLPRWAGSNGSATVLVDARGNRTLVLKMSTAEPVDGSREVWLIDRNVKQMRSLGLMTGSEARLTVPRGINLITFPIVDVSDEPANDPSTAHSGNSIVRGILG